ncbi:MAG: anaerobic ribonucleoside-triphosphate reductase activating protein [Malacoplasma sp.]|nr:anaerobic ribonucleoside-triphosphate reductase activating protein [Mycoplasmataceae bacterium]MDD7685629.1 anaerobic ribonucleoside-triphosphate reductase activating protein [Mycoplasmataceae bacterium]MDY2887529.1 anaerobic ribonucleoside-triphosphate reductase activating protein [Malacoplasma sp.]
MLNDDSKLIRLAGIAENSLVNGKGLRKVFFSQGCSHHCEGCFNQHTWEFAGGRMFDMDELVQKVKDEPFLDGVTFSGGDPFQQADKFAYLAKKLHEANINIWAYTGYTFEELMKLAQTNPHIKQMINNVDVIVDGRFMKDKMSENLKYCGSSNQRVIDVKSSLNENKIILFKD